MKRIKFGKGVVQTPMKKTELGQALISGMKEVIQHEQGEVQLKETHHHTTILKESRDKWARKHSKLSARKMEKIVDEMNETLNQQNEMLHMKRNSVHNASMEIEKLKIAIQALKEQKPVEIHTLTKETVLKPQPQNKLIVVGVILSIVLSILALINK